MHDPKRRKAISCFREQRVTRTNRQTAPDVIWFAFLRELWGWLDGMRNVENVSRS
jgi:hypothetical protein